MKIDSGSCIIGYYSLHVMSKSEFHLPRK